MPKPSDRYAKVTPLFRNLDRRPGRQTEEERVRSFRYPPLGDVAAWVQNGPTGARSRARNWHGQTIAEHLHTADGPGLDCPTCGFPWWPDDLRRGD